MGRSVHRPSARLYGSWVWGITSVQERRLQSQRTSCEVLLIARRCPVCQQKWRRSATSGDCTDDSCGSTLLGSFRSPGRCSLTWAARPFVTICLDKSGERLSGRAAEVDRALRIEHAPWRVAYPHDQHSFPSTPSTRLARPPSLPRVYRSYLFYNGVRDADLWGSFAMRSRKSRHKQRAAPGEPARCVNNAGRAARGRAGVAPGHNLWGLGSLLGCAAE